MLPTAAFFTQVMKQLGVKKTDHVVLYDTWAMNMFGYRAAWMFQAMGHDRVRVLDGGFNKWVSEGQPVESTDETVTEADFAYSCVPSKIKKLEEIENIDHEAF